MTLLPRLLFTAIAAVLAFVGTLAIVSETHTGYARYQGVRTVVGPDAVWFGETCLLLALLPLVPWLPARWVGLAVAAWSLALMGWLFLPFFLR